MSKVQGINESSYEAILAAIEEVGRKGGSSEEVSEALVEVRDTFQIDEKTFSLILAGVTDYVPKKGEDAKQGIIDNMDRLVRAGRQDHPVDNKDKTGISGLDQLRPIVAGFPRNEVGMEIVRYREYQIPRIFDEAYLKQVEKYLRGENGGKLDAKSQKILERLRAKKE